MKFGEVPVAEAEGAILAHSLKLGTTALKRRGCCRGRCRADRRRRACHGSSSPGSTPAISARTRRPSMSPRPLPGRRSKPPPRSPAAPTSSPSARASGLRSRAARPPQPGRRGGDARHPAALRRRSNRSRWSPRSRSSRSQRRRRRSRAASRPRPRTARCCALRRSVPRSVGLVQTRLPGLKESILDKTRRGDRRQARRARLPARLRAALRARDSELAATIREALSTASTSC